MRDNIDPDDDGTEPCEACGATEGYYARTVPGVGPSYVCVACGATFPLVIAVESDSAGDDQPF